MKTYTVILIIILAIFLSACSPAAGTTTEQAGTTVAPAQSQTKVKIQIPTKVPAPTLIPTPTLLEQIPPSIQYTHPYSITSVYDKFTTLTKVMMLNPGDPAITQPPGSLYAFFYYSTYMPSTVNIGFFTSNESWVYLDCYDLIFLLNGETRLNANSTWGGDVTTYGFVSEMVNAELPLKDFLSLVNADSVEGRLCLDEFIVEPWQMQGLRDFASKLDREY